MTGSSASRARGCAATATRWRAARCSTGAGRSLDEPAWDGADATLADELLDPERDLLRRRWRRCRGTVDVHAFAHITGGGLPGNVNRILPTDGDVRIRRGVWAEPRIFAEIQRAGEVADDEME